MPGTSDDRLFQPAFTNWTAPVRAHVINRVETTVNVKDCDFATIHLVHFSLTYRNVVGCCNGFEIIRFHADMLTPLEGRDPT